MPFLNDEVKEWIALELESLGVEDLAVYALEAGTEGDERRVMVATEIGLLDHRYAPFGSSARYRLAMLMYPWQVLRGVELRADTFRLWAREHRTRWSFRLHHPHFEAATEMPDLGGALCDLARVCAVMAEPFGVPAGRVSSDVPGAIPGGTAADSADRRRATGARAGHRSAARPRRAMMRSPWRPGGRTLEAAEAQPSEDAEGDDEAAGERQPDGRPHRRGRGDHRSRRGGSRGDPDPLGRPRVSAAGTDAQRISIASPKLKNR